MHLVNIIFTSRSRPFLKHWNSTTCLEPSSDKFQNSEDRTWFSKTPGARKSENFFKDLGHPALEVMRKSNGMLSDGLRPASTAQHDHVHADTSLREVSVEKLATLSVAKSWVTQHSRCSYMKLVKHNKMRWQLGHCCGIAGEIVSGQPWIGTAVEYVGFVCVVTDMCKIRFTSQKSHCDIAVDIAAQNNQLLKQLGRE